MRIAFFVNDIATEHSGYTTTVLAHQAAKRGHEVMYITPSDFMVGKDDSLRAHVRRMPAKKWASAEGFFKTLGETENEADAVDLDGVDLLWLRSDPSLDASTAPWRAEAGILFGREAARRGTLVLNDPTSLGQAVNKLYFQSFPAEARAETIITRDERDIKAFAKEYKNNIILKPLQGSGGSGVFKLDKETARNLNQMTEAICRDGYVICQTYIPAAKKGDIRLFLMNGKPLEVGGKYAAVRRVAAKDDIRSNIHAGGKAEAVEIGKTELRVAEIIRPKLIADGMFLVGVDIVGDKILEVNVFSPGNLKSCSTLTGVDFSEAILASVERKIEIKRNYGGIFDNRHLAML
jgi:glutathione synthase